MNVYEIRNLNVEFVKDFKKEENEVMLNKFYPYYPLKYQECYKFKNTNIPCGIYPKTEFNRRDPMTYMKLKGGSHDRWLFNDNGDMVFKIIKRCDFYCEQPMVLFLDYLSDNSFIILQYQGFGKPGVKYMNYREVIQDDGRKKIEISWVNSRNSSTIFVFDKVKWRELQWIQNRDPNIANFDWGNLDSEDRNILKDLVSPRSAASSRGF